MEKQRNKFRSKLKRGLLALVLASLSASPLYAKFLTNADVQSLRFSASNSQSMFTNTDIRFEVDIPYVTSSDINVSAPVEMDNVTFKTLKRTDSMDEEGGVKIELWFSFSKKGTYQLKPLNLKIQGFNRQIAFEPVTIKTNPKDQDPIIIIRFDDGTVVSSENQEIKSPVRNMVVGEKICFTVLFKYGVQLVNYNWDIPKDSIFTQTNAYEITQLKYKEKSSLEEEIPVSDFEWTVLVPGEMSFPSFYMTVTSNNGYKGEIKLAPFTVNILEKQEEDSKVEKTLFDDAFTMEEKKDVETEVKVMTLDDCRQLADLRNRERHSLLGFNRKARVRFEQSFNLPSTQNEFQVSNIFIAVLLFIVSIVLFIVFLRKKKILVNIATTTFIVLSLVLVIVFIVKSQNIHGISKGNKLYAIPDPQAESKIELQAGSYVSITENAGNWFYVQIGENGGWCTRDDILLIK